MENFRLVPFIILAVVIVVITVVTIVVMYRKRNPGSRPATGANQGVGPAVAAMQAFARSNGFRFIAPAAITHGEKTAQLDAVVVGYFGVLGLVAYGYNGEVYGEAGADEWVRIAPGGQRTSFENPINRCSAAVRVLRDVMIAANMRKVPVEVVSVFTDKGVQLGLPRSIAQMRTKDFKDLLKKEKYLEDTGLDLDAVETAIKNAVKG